jgi:hypothetical protein
MQGRRLLERENTFSVFFEYVRKVRGNFLSEKITNSNWDIFGSNPEDLIVAQLRGDDGKEDHVVSIVEGWIFDSNFPRALPMSRDALDLCCSDGEGITDHFVSIVEARVLKQCNRLRHGIRINGKQQKGAVKRKRKQNSKRKA